MTQVVSGAKPEAVALAASTHPEPGGVEMQFASLPDKFRLPGRVKKNECIIAPAKPKKHIQFASGFRLEVPDMALEASEYAAQIGKIQAVGRLFYDSKRWGDAAQDAPKIGDVVLFVPYVGRRFVVGKEKFLIIEDSHILLDGIDETDDFTLFT